MRELSRFDHVLPVRAEDGAPASLTLGAAGIGAQHRDAVRRLAIFDVPVPGDGTPVFFDNRWHHGLHWEADLPEALTAGREDVYLGFFYRTWGARPDAIPGEAHRGDAAASPYAAGSHRRVPRRP